MSLNIASSSTKTLYILSQRGRTLQNTLELCMRTPFYVATKRTMTTIKRHNSTSKVVSVPPTLSEVRDSPLTIESLSNPYLVRLSASGHEEARIEVLKRHIMDIDSVEYDEAEKKFLAIEKANRKLNIQYSIPNKIGLVAAFSLGAISIPLCFHLETVEWFNQHYVTADIPEPKDLETWLEVGSWSWNWMEPMLGQASFLILCLQFCRSQFQTLGIKPYSETIKIKRADDLIKLFPQYDARIIKDYSVIQPFDWWLVHIFRKVRGLS